MQFDMPLSDLQNYKPALTRPPDFDRFWQTALSELKAEQWEPRLERLEYPLPQIKAYKVSLPGFKGTTDGSTLVGWYIVPELDIFKRNGRLPLLIHTHGYGDYREEIFSWLGWALQGIAVLVMDVRGQGESLDRASYTGNRVTGHMTLGLMDPNQYYYRNVYLDTVRLLDFAVSRPEIDPDRLILMGVSQGGGVALAVAALDQRLHAIMPGVPYLCDWQNSLEKFNKGPYQELVEYFSRYPSHTEQALKNLRYFDGVNFADRINCPTLLAVGLIDEICPVSSSFAVINHLKCEKELKIYPWNGHEAGWSPAHNEVQLQFVHKLLS